MLVARPFLPPVFDHLQYAKIEGEGLGVVSSPDGLGTRLAWEIETHA